MTKEQLWAQYVAKYPSFSGDEDIKLTAAGLRRLFDLTWRYADQEGYRKGVSFKTGADSFYNTMGKNDPFGGIFK